MNKKTVLYFYFKIYFNIYYNNGLIFSHKKQGDPAICDNTDRP